jgi:NAD(P)H dehydrogenase (quinone)
MKILTVYAHPNPKSFCKAVLQQFSEGLKAAGHSNEVVDLYAIGFDPVFREADFASYVNESIPKDVLEKMNLKKYVLDSMKGPFRRFLASRWLGNKSDALTSEGWDGYAKGRVPLLDHEKALVINTTLFREEEYKAKWEKPMSLIIDDWGLRYPGVKQVEHVYFYGVPAVDDETRKGYLDRAYHLGKTF